MKDRITETPIIPDAWQPERSSKANNYAILNLPPEYGDQTVIQAKATEMVRAMDLRGKYDAGWENIPLAGLDADASPALGRDRTVEPLVRYYAALAKSWGFTDNARLGVFIQSDKNDNPNNIIHRDGIGAEAQLILSRGNHVRSVRFVYPIGRPGTILYPTLDHVGNPLKGFGLEVVNAPTEEDHLILPHAMSVEGAEKQRLLDEAGAVQLEPGETLVFDMTNSPWHVAPEPTPDGAVMTVGVFESW